MTGLVEFLKARLNEDEQAARFVIDGPGEVIRRGLDLQRIEIDGEIRYAFLTLDPERMLAEVEAKRQIMRGHGQPHECVGFTGGGEHSVTDGKPWELWEPEHTADHGPCFALRCLALPYADHPEYDENWRP